jgi:hypothetical protein
MVTAVITVLATLIVGEPPFSSYAGKPNFPQMLEKNGGDDGTRTCGLCRES